jgi:hypothetical protein
MTAWWLELGSIFDGIIQNQEHCSKSSRNCAKNCQSAQRMLAAFHESDGKPRVKESLMILPGPSFDSMKPFVLMISVDR